MPTYEYRCNKCGEHFDVFQTFAEEPLKKHPGKCGGKVLKVLSPAGIVFSGSGFYKTDNRSSSRSSRSAGSESKASSSESKSSESKSSESKTSESKSSDSGSSSSKTSSGENKKSA